MNRSTPSLPVRHQLMEPTQTQVHWVGDAIQPSYPLLSPSPPALSLSYHEGLFNESALRIRWPKYWSSGLQKIEHGWSDLSMHRSILNLTVLLVNSIPLAQNHIQSGQLLKHIWYTVFQWNFRFLEDKNQVLYLSHIPSKLLAEWEAVSHQKDGSLHGTYVALVT